MTTYLRHHLLPGLALVLLLALPAGAGVGDAGGTLANLQEAYNGEVNAEARYLACADRAEAEGHDAVASLFRAAATAERIHASNQAAVIRALGAEPQARIVGAVVGDTRQNLQDAVDGERYEQQTMYPEFIAMARREGLPEAVRSLEFAAQVEDGHAVLFTRALAGLEDPEAAWTQFMVCPTCGGTRPADHDHDDAHDHDDVRCPFCHTPCEQFLAVR